MSDAKEIDHEYTRYAVCPHCGHVHRDCWEWADGEEAEGVWTQCESCEKGMEFSRYITVRYSTEKASP